MQGVVAVGSGWRLCFHWLSMHSFYSFLQCYLRDTWALSHYNWNGHVDSLRSGVHLFECTGNFLLFPQQHLPGQACLVSLREAVFRLMMTACHPVRNSTLNQSLSSLLWSSQFNQSVKTAYYVSGTSCCDGKKKKDNVHFSASHRIGGDTDKYMKSFEYRLDCVSARLEIW